MEDLFRNVLEASVYGSVVILAVMVLRLVLRRIPKRLICLLWLLAGLRLVMPFSLESSFSLQPRLDSPGAVTAPAEHVPAQTEPLPPVDHKPNQEQATIPQTETPATSGEYAETIHIHQEESEPLTWKQGAAYAWALGILIMGAGSILSYRKLKMQVREACITGDGCWECAGLDTAFVLGFLPPKIYLPMNLPEETRGHIVAHERAHIARGDHWCKLLGYLVLMIHWFNPLVWLGYHLLCRDMEGACDERVIRNMDLAQRKAYSGALLSCAGKHRVVSACPVAFGETSVKQRILSVLRYKKPTFWVTVLGLAALVFVAVCLMTAPGGENLYGVLDVPRDVKDGIMVRSETGMTFLSAEKELEDALRMLRSVGCESVSLPQTPATGYQLRIGEKDVLFSDHCEYAWTAADSCWKIDEPETLKAWFLDTMEAVYDRETSGESFATVQEQENWLRGISADVVSSAYIHARGETTREGNTTSTSASFGYLAARRFDELLKILNGLPDRAVMEKTTHKRIVYGELQNTLGIKGGVYISLTDPVNGLVGVVLLDSKDNVKLLLTDETQKVEANVECLDNLQCWTLQDEKLHDFLMELWDHPPIITQWLRWPEVQVRPDGEALDRAGAALKSFQKRESYQANEWHHGETGSALAHYWQSGENWLRTFQDPKGNEQPAYLKMNGCAYYSTPDRTGSGTDAEWTGGFTFENEADFLPWLRSFDWDSVEMYPGSAGLHQIETISLEEGSYETVTCVITSPFPVYKRTAQAGLLTIAISPEGELAVAELFATYEEIQNGEITEETILYHNTDVTWMTTQVLTYDREEMEAAIAQAYDTVPQQQREKALEDMYRNQCRTALAAVQAMEYYHMRVSYEFYQGTHKENRHTADYWFDGENLLRTADVNGMTRMTLLHNGSVYQSRGAAQNQWNPLKEGNGELKDAASWIMYYPWDDGAIRFINAVEENGETTVSLRMDENAAFEGINAESYELLFTFGSDGDLKSVGLVTRNSAGTTMDQHIEWIDSEYEEIQRVIQEQIYSIELAD